MPIDNEEEEDEEMPIQTEPVRNVERTVIDDTIDEDDDGISPPVITVDNSEIPSFLQRIKMRRK